MTVRRLSRPAVRAARPATVSLSQKSLTEWYAEWKARKAAETSTGTPSRPASEPTAAASK